MSLTGADFLSAFNLAVSVLIALVLHELAHGFVSYKLGDPTPKAQGRLTLNPLAHIDPMGAICLFLCGFGWAKPVAIDYSYYKHKKLGTALVSLAGPCMNFIIALVAAFGLKLCSVYGVPQLINFFYILFSINVGLGVFNLIPFPPLDGSKILASVLPNKYYDTWMYLERYGFIILMFLLFFNILTPILSIGTGFISSLIFGIVGIG